MSGGWDIEETNECLVMWHNATMTEGELRKSASGDDVNPKGRGLAGAPYSEALK